MATAKQIAANRRNAQKSTGPRTEEGKAKVSQNRTTHGLCGKFFVLAEVEKQENYETLLARFIEEEQPTTQRQHELVVKMARHTWLANRALQLQDNCFVLEPKTPEQVKSGEIPVGVDYHLERYVRYHAAQDRAYQRAAAELDKLKKAERLAEIGFESQKRAQAEEIRKAEKHALAIATATIRKQREEIRLGDDLSKILPPDFNPDDLNSLFSAAATGTMTHTRSYKPLNQSQERSDCSLNSFTHRRHHTMSAPTELLLRSSTTEPATPSRIDPEKTRMLA